MTIKNLSFDEVIDRLLALKQPHYDRYFSMYSSWYGGIITDPALMMVPIDDHLVHRGDGVFEALRCTGWKLYALNRHLDRLERSASMSALDIPFTREEIGEIVLETIRAGGRADCLLRIVVSRGPGGFSANPYESVGSQLYVTASLLKPPPPEAYELGASLKTTTVPVKTDYFATVKNCNYMPNVLMSKEARDAGADYPVSVDERGFLAEGATENVGIVTRDRRFLMPRFTRILRGTTIMRVAELAAPLVASGELASIGEADIRPEDAYEAAEVMMFGTTLDAVPIVRYDGRAIGDGKPGPFAKKFGALLREDQENSPEMVTRVR